MSTINHDLQATHQILTLLEQSKRKSDEILDQLPGVFAVICTGKSSGAVLKGNVALANLYGINRERVFNQNLGKLFRPETWEIFETYIKKISGSLDVPSLEFELAIRDDNEDRPYLWHLTRFALPDRSGDCLISVIGRDISELRKTERSLAEIFANIPIGIFTIGKNGKIEAKYSAYLEVIFGRTDIAGGDLLSLIFSQNWDELKPAARESVLGMQDCLNAPSMIFEVHKGQFPEDVRYTFNTGGEIVERYLGIRIHPVTTNDIVERLMVIIEDKTSIVRARLREEKMREMEEKSISIILQLKRCSPDVLPLLVEETALLTERLLTQLKNPKARDIANTLHGIKGNARVAGLNTFKEDVHHLESVLKTASDPLNEDHLSSIQRVLSDWTEIQRLYQAISQTKDISTQGAEGGIAIQAKEIEEIKKLFDRLIEIRGQDQSFQKALISERIQLALRAFSFIKAEDQKPILLTRVNETARTLGKKVALVLDSGDVRLDKSCNSGLSESLMHMINNSVAHGIEAPEERVQAGKPEEGTIHITLSERFGQVKCVIEDDGAGVNVEKLKKAAVKKGILTFDQSLLISDADARNLIFAPGFSTVEEVSEIAGRGVGMDAVQSVIEQFSGKIKVEPRAPYGTCITFTLRNSSESSLVRHLHPLANVLDGLQSSLQSMAADYGTSIDFSTGGMLASKAKGLIYCDAMRISMAITIYLVSQAHRGSVDVVISERKDGLLEVSAKMNTGKMRAHPAPISLDYDVPLGICDDFIAQHGGTVRATEKDFINLTFGRILDQEEIGVMVIHLNLPGDQAKISSEQVRIMKVAEKLSIPVEIVITEKHSSEPQWRFGSNTGGVWEFTAIPTSDKAMETAFILHIENNLGIKKTT